jgi:hypothetical protein
VLGEPVSSWEQLLGCSWHVKAASRSWQEHNELVTWRGRKASLIHHRILPVLQTCGLESKATTSPTPDAVHCQHYTELQSSINNVLQSHLQVAVHCQSLLLCRMVAQTRQHKVEGSLACTGGAAAH